jgi:hypothetical protein
MGNGPLNAFQILQNLRRAAGQQPTLPSAQQPSPQDYADALEAYGRQPIRTPGALASNLAASAIQRLNPNGQSATPMEFNLPANVDPRSVGLSQSPLTVGALPPIGSGQ